MIRLAKDHRLTNTVAGLIGLVALIGVSAVTDPSVVFGTSPTQSAPPVEKESLHVDVGMLNRMIDDRREQLARRQTSLREAIGGLGRNHPSVDALQRQLDDVERQLEVWSSPTSQLTDIDDSDLRLLVVQLLIRIDQLESKVQQQQLQRQRTQTNQIQIGGGGRSPRRRGPPPR